MKTFFKTIIVSGLIITALVSTTIAQEPAKEIVKKSEDKFKGETSSYSEMTMKIVRPTWDRTITFKSWSKGTEMSLTLITSPAKEKGQSFLKRGNDMWNWNPTISRFIKLPPSMMSEGWMGSDYSNDDVLQESSLVKDYNHKSLGSESIDGNDCHVIELNAKEDAPVAWERIKMWISKKEYLQLKAEYYDEDDYLIRTLVGKNIQTFDGRTLPGTMEIIPEDEQGNKTIITINSMEFNPDLDDSFFSQQNMKRVR